MTSAGSPDDAPCSFDVIEGASPLWRMDVGHTVAIALLGRQRSGVVLRAWRPYHAISEWMYRISLMVTCSCWFLEDTTLAATVQTACLILVTPTITIRFLYMSLPLLRLLPQHYEFCFTTALNAAGVVLLAHTLGDARAISSVVVFFSYQTTICIDATIYNVVPAARSSLVHFFCVTTTCAFAALQSFTVRQRADEAHQAVNLLAVNLLVNVSTTLAMFIFNKAYKRRKCFSRRKIGADQLVPLGICFNKLAIRPQAKARVTRTQTRHISVVPALVKDGAARISLGAFKTQATTALTTIQLLPRTLNEVSNCNTLVPSLQFHNEISLGSYVVLQISGFAGLLCTCFSLASILIWKAQDSPILWVSGIISFGGSFVFCGVFFIHLQKQLLHEVLIKFDFWFIMFQCVSINVCLSDMLSWDFRCLNLISWVWWFLWILLQDAMLPQTRAHLRYRKTHAMILLVVFLVSIVLIGYTLFDSSDFLRGRKIIISHLSPTVETSLHTKNVLLNRLWTILIWALRLVYALGWQPDKELVLIKGSLAYESRWDITNLATIPGVASVRDSATGQSRSVRKS